MRLPGYQNRPVETLARYDVSGPAREWAAETRAMQAAVGTVSAIGDLVRKVDEVKQKEAARERAFEVRRRYMTARDRLLTTEAYDLNDPEQVDFLGSSLDGFDLRDGQGGMRSTVRKDEIISRAWESKRDQILKDGMEGMTPFQQKLIDNELRYEIFGIDNGIRKEQLLSTNDYMRTSAINVADGLAKEGNLVGAIEAIQDTEQFTEEEKRDIVQGLRKRTEIERYAEALMSEDEAKLQSQMRTLSDPEYAGTLSSSERMTYWARTKRILDKKEADRQSALKVDTRMLTYGARQSTDALMRGMPPTPEMSDQVQRLYAQGKDVEARRLELAMSHSMVLSEVAHLPFAEQDAFIAQLKADADDPEQYNLAVGIEKALAGQRRAFAKDTPQFAMDSGNYEISEIDWQAENLPEMLSKRRHDITKIRVQTGGASSYLSDIEVAQFNAMMQEASPEQVMRMNQAINQSFGREAGAIWDQLKVKDSGSKYAKAGEISSYEIAGSEEVSRSILKAHQMSKDSPEFAKLIKSHDRSVRKSDSYKRLMGVYPPGPQQNQLIEAVRARYSYLVGMTGETEFDQGTYDQAIEDVTGGLVDILGRSVEAPVAGLDQDVFDDWTDNMSAAYLERLGNPDWDARVLADAIQEGEVIVIPVGRNAFGLAPKNAPTSVIYDKFTGRPYRFSYNQELAEELREPGFIDTTGDWISP